MLEVKSRDLRQGIAHIEHLLSYELDRGHSWQDSMTGGAPVQDPLRFGAEEEVRGDQAVLAGIPLVTVLRPSWVDRDKARFLQALPLDASSNWLAFLQDMEDEVPLHEEPLGPTHEVCTW